MTDHAMHRTLLSRIIAIAITAAAAWALLSGPARAQSGCPPACSGMTLDMPNFSHADLRKADFSGATIKGAVFIRAKLAGANFSNATFVAGDNGAPSADFTFADLSGASFAGAKFPGVTYFTYANIGCADFSNTDISSGTAVFGEAPHAYSPTTNCRTKFQQTTMSCEFIDDWRYFDLTGADVGACKDQLAGRNFAGAVMSGVDLSQAVLDATSFNGAHLERALLTRASLQCGTARDGNANQCVDFTGASLQAANLDHANLTGATMHGAYLSNVANHQISDAASVKQAHLKNVNLSDAQLSGVNFLQSNFYGDNATAGSTCTTSGMGGAGYTQNCASARNATLTGTNFNQAYLFGVDFGNAAIAGVNFTQAVLAGDNFAGATVSSNTNSGSATLFVGAYLQGTNLDQATLSGADLTNAFVDITQGGNIVYVELTGSVHNQFACSTPSTCVPDAGQDVCVLLPYGQTTLPYANTTITCPDDVPAGAGGCGSIDAAKPSNTPRWNSTLAIGSPGNPGPPPGWYAGAATYTPQAPDAVVCNGKGSAAAVASW